MAKYKVQTKVTKSETYTVEVDADSEYEAEQFAGSLWRDKTSDTFQIDKPDTFYFDTAQLTYNCEDCGKDFPESEIFCDKCVGCMRYSLANATHPDYRGDKILVDKYPDAWKAAQKDYDATKSSRR